VTRDPRALPQGGRRLEISHPALIGSCLELGASLAVSGVCLTVVAGDEAQSSFDLAPETLARTTLGELREGDEVNLEPALRTGQAFGGHWVQGHVDGVVDVREVRDRSEDEVEVSTGWFGHRVLRFSLPQWARSGVVEKGSVTLDGVSLTVSACGSDWFEVALIPHTLEVTTLGARRPGDRLNLEIDILAKYVERALAARGLGGGTA
jgi:riboflavin synthase